MIDEKLLDQAARNVRVRGDPDFGDVERSIRMRHPWPGTMRGLLLKIQAEYRRLAKERQVEMFTAGQR